MNETRTSAASTASAKARASAVYERNAQIIARIKAGEKRYMLAAEYGLSVKSMSQISIKAGLPRWTRYKRTP